MLFKVGDRIIEGTLDANKLPKDKNGKPILKATYTETKKNKNGGTDVIVHVPSIALKAKNKLNPGVSIPGKN